MDRSNIIIMAIGVPMVKNILTFMGDQKLGGNDLSSVNILLILIIDTWFIFGIFLAKASSLLSVKHDIFKDWIKPKFYLFLSIIYFDAIVDHLALTHIMKSKAEPATARI